MPIIERTETVPVAGINQRGHQHFAEDQSIIEFLRDTVGAKELVSTADGQPCLNCGKPASMGYEFLGSEYVAKEACVIPGGLVYQNSINVPSGRLVFAKHLDDLFPELPPGATYGDPAVAQESHAREAADYNLIRGVLGKTTPNLYQDTHTGDLLLATPGTRETQNGREQSVPSSWKLLSTIDDDLSSYAAVDYNWYRFHGGGNQGSHVVVEVPAAEWVFTHYACGADFADAWLAEPNIFVHARPR